MNSQRGKASSNASRRRDVKRQPNVQAKAQIKKVNKGMGRRRAVDSSTMSSSVASSAYGTITTTTAPKQTSRNAGHRVVHRELYSTLPGSVAWSNQLSIALNPGLPTAFPWLSTIASQFEHYTIHALSIVFVSTSSTAATGAVIISPEYDPSANTPANEVGATQINGCIEAPTWQSIRCNLDQRSLHPAGPRKFVRTGNTAGDIRLTDAGNVFISTSGQASNANVGKVFLEYDIEFFKPQSSNNSASNQPRRVTTLTNSTSLVYTTNVAGVVPFDQISNPDPLHIGFPTGGVFIPPAGAYILTCRALAMDTANESFSAKIEIRKNGTPLGPVVYDTRGPTGFTNSAFPITTQVVGTFNGTTDNCVVFLTMVGAAGTLTAVAGSVFLVWELA